MISKIEKMLKTMTLKEKKALLKVTLDSIMGIAKRIMLYAIIDELAEREKVIAKSGNRLLSKAKWFICHKAGDKEGVVKKKNEGVADYFGVATATINMKVTNNNTKVVYGGKGCKKEGYFYSKKTKDLLQNMKKHFLGE